jgi:tRNA (uracil-5-)-methyltransferase
VSRFERIVYISCNPDTLKENLAELVKTHNIEKFALFDQFPYTHHVETGVILSRKK